MKPHSHEEHIQHTFDAFCKKVLRNEARDYLDELARKRNREISFSDLPVEVMEQLSICDIYFVEKQSFGVLDYRVHIDNDELAEAIAALPAQKRDIILLSYFLDMPDSEIAKALNMVRSSVAYRRSATLKLLRELMGGKADEQQPEQRTSAALYCHSESSRRRRGSHQRGFETLCGLYCQTVTARAIRRIRQSPSLCGRRTATEAGNQAHNEDPHFSGKLTRLPDKHFPLSASPTDCSLTNTRVR